MPVTRSQKSTTATNAATADSQDGATGLNRGLSDSDAQNRVHKSARAEMRSILEGNDLVSFSLTVLREDVGAHPSSSDPDPVAPF